MGKNWRANLGTSCKMAGGLAEEDICKAKIKLIFKGAASDMFIDDFDSLDMKGMGFKLERSNLNLEVKEEVADLGIVNFEAGTDNGYIYKLKKEHKAGQYHLVIINNKEQESLFYLTGAYSACAMSEDIEYININRKAITIPRKLFSTKYMVDGYINIVIELALNIRINCEMEGGSEAYIHQKKIRKSLIVPLDYKTGYYLEDYARYNSNIIQRENGVFPKYFNRNDGSIGFKAVNYRKDIYTGNENNILKNELFETGFEAKEFYHTELIENKVFIMLECKGINYLLNKEEVFQNIVINTIEDLSIYSKDFFYIANIDDNKVEDVEYTNIQFIFMHLIFDGKSIKYKDIYIEQINFNETGEVVI